MEQWIKEFVDKLRFEGKAEKTINQYSVAVK